MTAQSLAIRSLLVASFVACGSAPSTGPEPDAAAAPTRGFRLATPEVELGAGDEQTYCYFFRTPNTETMAVHRWSSSMTPGSHHLIMFLSDVELGEPGTVGDCGFATAIAGQWTYAAQTPENELALPTDDGDGLPLAQDVAANSPGFLQMHYLNATDEPIPVRVELDAEAFQPNVAYTKTAPFVTYNSQIEIPPGARDHVETATCDVPIGAKFWLMSTHAHSRATHTAVKDVVRNTNGETTSETVVFESDNWEHPGAARFMTPATFYEFAGRLDYACTYDNPTTEMIETGDSAQTDEMCMASGYFFPATRPRFCIDGSLR